MKEGKGCVWWAGTCNGLGVVGGGLKCNGTYAPTIYTPKSGSARGLTKPKGLAVSMSMPQAGPALIPGGGLATEQALPAACVRRPAPSCGATAPIASRRIASAPDSSASCPNARPPPPPPPPPRTKIELGDALLPE